ncbi:MAG: NAD(P)H-dependent oxidoreductase [Desulfamplus sp.]|nr:NAD(P)H-dependent oxidoreductase [Desulfamplus sp.]
MKFIVLNGTTKNIKQHSMNLAKIERIKNAFPEIEFKIYRISNEINKIAANESYFLDILSDIKNADAVIWSTPVYIGLIPSELKRFIELTFDRDFQHYFANKPAVVILSSIKLYDTVAIDYMREICEDLNMRYCGHFSAGMVEPVDLKFIKNFIADINNNFEHPRETLPIKLSDYIFKSSDVESIKYKKLSSSKKVLVISDKLNGKPLDGFTDFLKKICPDNMEHYDLNDLDIKCGCISCFECGLENRCSIKDGFVPFYKNRVMRADVIIYLGTQKDRFLSWKWKQFLDRRFFSNHIPTLIGKQLLCIVSGNRVDGRTIFNYFEMYSQLERAHFCGAVFDDAKDDQAVADMIYKSVKRSLELSELEYAGNETYLYEGARAYLNESLEHYIYSGLYADYRYYKKHNFKRLNFAQKIGKSIILNLYELKTVREYVFYDKQCSAIKMKVIDLILGIAYRLRGRAY